MSVMEPLSEQKKLKSLLGKFVAAFGRREDCASIVTLQVDKDT